MSKTAIIITFAAQHYYQFFNALKIITSTLNQLFNKIIIPVNLRGKSVHHGDAYVYIRRPR
jgi:hypothetical protein